MSKWRHQVIAAHTRIYSSPLFFLFFFKIESAWVEPAICSSRSHSRGSDWPKVFSSDYDKVSRAKGGKRSCSCYSFFCSGSMIVSKCFIMMMTVVARVFTGKSWTRLSNQLEMCLKAKSIWPVGVGSIKRLISLLFLIKNVFLTLDQIGHHDKQQQTHI